MKKYLVLASLALLVIDTTSQLHAEQPPSKQEKSYVVNDFDHSSVFDIESNYVSTSETNCNVTANVKADEAVLDLPYGNVSGIVSGEYERSKSISIEIGAVSKSSTWSMNYRGGWTQVYHTIDFLPRVRWV